MLNLGDDLPVLADDLIAIGIQFILGPNKGDDEDGDGAQCRADGTEDGKFVTFFIIGGDDRSQGAIRNLVNGIKHTEGDVGNRRIDANSDPARTTKEIDDVRTR